LIVGAATVVGLIILFGPHRDDEGPPPTEVVVVETAPPQQVAGPTSVPPPTTRPAQTPNPQSIGFDREAIRRIDPNAVIVSITAYGMPARVGLQTQNSADQLSSGSFVPDRGVNVACLPDVQYASPCTSYVLVKKGATIVVSAGNSLAGFWPSLDHLRGPGCDIGKVSADRTCTVQASSDLDYVAVYYGSDSSGDYVYPRCPPNRGTSTSEWIRRCQ
jgi:hypothetical protein